MLVSIFTPTHNPTYLDRVAASLKAQTYPFFEWIVVPNGQVNSVTPLDPRMRVVNYPHSDSIIGKIKKFACEQAKGDILLELDHDDQLTPDCLEEVVNAFRDPGVDFVYSNCCEIAGDGGPFAYDAAYGWQYRDFAHPYTGQRLLECLAFPPGPASFSRIWFGPNHVRAWRSGFYRKIGGHNPAFDVLDDQDLFCRSYIHGNVRHIDKCLYIYYYTGDNSSKGDLNARIQSLTLELHDLYIQGLCEKWCDLTGLRKIDLCGGIDPYPGYDSIDLVDGDITWDLNNFPWPIAEDSVGVIRAQDAIEHLLDPVNVMTEIHRILAPGGFLLVEVPSAEGRGAFQDPTHKCFFVSNSFWYYTRSQYMRYIRFKGRFQLVRLLDYYPSDFHRTHNIPYVKAHLMKLPPQGSRVPGVVEC